MYKSLNQRPARSRSQDPRGGLSSPFTQLLSLFRDLRPQEDTSSVEGCSSKLLWLLSSYLWLCVPEDRRQRGTTDPCHQEEVVLMLHNGSEETKVLHSSVPVPEDSCVHEWTESRHSLGKAWQSAPELQRYGSRPL